MLTDLNGKELHEGDFVIVTFQIKSIDNSGERENLTLTTVEPVPATNSTSQINVNCKQVELVKEAEEVTI